MGCCPCPCCWSSPRRRRRRSALCPSSGCSCCSSCSSAPSCWAPHRPSLNASSEPSSSSVNARVVVVMAAASRRRRRRARNGRRRWLAAGGRVVLYWLVAGGHSHVSRPDKRAIVGFWSQQKHAHAPVAEAAAILKSIDRSIGRPVLCVVVVSGMRPLI